jgi:hypothetical protein
MGYSFAARTLPKSRETADLTRRIYLYAVDKAATDDMASPGRLPYNLGMLAAMDDAGL